MGRVHLPGRYRITAGAVGMSGRRPAVPLTRKLVLGLREPLNFTQLMAEFLPLTQKSDGEHFQTDPWLFQHGAPFPSSFHHARRRPAIRVRTPSALGGLRGNPLFPTDETPAMRGIARRRRIPNYRGEGVCSGRRATPELGPFFASLRSYFVFSIPQRRVSEVPLSGATSSGTRVSKFNASPKTLIPICCVRSMSAARSFATLNSCGLRTNGHSFMAVVGGPFRVPADL